jgi:hypothetical protein
MKQVYDCYNNEYVKITVFDRDFSKNTKYSYSKITIGKVIVNLIDQPPFQNIRFFSIFYLSHFLRALSNFQVHLLFLFFNIFNHDT